MTSYPHLVKGQTIVATHEPPRITLNEDRSLPMSPVLLHPQPTRLTGVWWFKNEREGRTRMPCQTCFGGGMSLYVHA